MLRLSRGGPIRTLIWLTAGFISGGAFGAAFGWLASWFQNGPEWWQGVTESARWFSVVGLVGGGLLSLEGTERPGNRVQEDR